jgi:membrane-associated protease RseP (regulator of RpoE activity)
MNRAVVVGALLVVIGGATVFFISSPDRHAASTGGDRSARAGNGSPGQAGRIDERTNSDMDRGELERRLRSLETRMAKETAERQRLKERLDDVTAQLAARGGGVGATAEDEMANPAAGAESPHVVAPDTAAVADADADDRSAMERALMAAGLDAVSAAELKHRHDELTMSEMYLRDQATREQWLNSERFTQEMAALEAQQTSVRDEIGDDAYDRYLYALGETNRVRVDDVLSQSPAAEAGLLAGDIIVRYADARIFAPGELVAQTRDGTAGETVRLEIIRNGQRIEVDVPRGPLGLRIAATQQTPDRS